jgi:16S rRNA (uracil1498-N3)-methyltransferase
VAHCHENLDRAELKEIPKLEQITFLIGPEGDFSEKEINYLSENKIKAVSLGNQRLRTETAGIFVAAWNYLHQN